MEFLFFRSLGLAHCFYLLNKFHNVFIRLLVHLIGLAANGEKRPRENKQRVVDEIKQMMQQRDKMNSPSFQSQTTKSHAVRMGKNVVNIRCIRSMAQQKQPKKKFALPENLYF